MEQEIKRKMREKKQGEIEGGEEVKGEKKQAIKEEKQKNYWIE